MQSYNSIKDIFVKLGYSELNDIKLLELTENEKNCDVYAGYCNLKLIPEKQEQISPTLILIPSHTTQIKLRIRKNKNTLEPYLIIPTLLHEFAHCLSYVERIYDVNKKIWKNEFHGEQFYKKYAELLQVAEKENIYTLTYAKGDKFSESSLKRFDRIYLMNDSTISTGYSKMFPSKIKNVWITVHYSGSSKKIKLEKDFLKVIKSKMKIKKKKFKLVDKNGNIVNVSNIDKSVDLFVCD